MTLPLPDLVRGLPDAVYVLDAELRYVLVNDRAAALIGREAGALEGTPCPDAPVPGLGPDTLAAYRTALATGRPRVRDQMHGPLGLCLEHRMAPVDGRLWVTLVDVTERRTDEQTLRRKAVVFDAAGDILVVTDAEGRITGWNPAAEEALGYRADEVEGRSVADIFVAEDAEAWAAGVIDRVAEEEEWTGEAWSGRKDGARRLLQIRVRAVRDRGGELIGTVGVCRDITDRQDAAEELAALLRAMEDVVLVLDREGRYRRVAPVAQDLLYRPPGDLVGRRFRDVLPAEQAAEFEAAIATALDERRTVQLEYSMVIDGRERWFHAALSPMEEDRVVWAARDITDRKLAVDRLRESEERFRQIAENVRDVFWIADRELSRFLYVSPAHREVWGDHSRELREPDLFLAHVHPDYREDVLEAVRLARSGELGAVTYPLIQPDGRTTWLSSRVFPVRDEAGRVYRLAGTTTDITARREAEEQRRLAMERLSTFLDTIPDQAWMKDREGRYVVVNEAYAAARGHAEEAIVGRSDFEIFSESTAARFAAQDERVMESGERYRVEDAVPAADGRTRWFEVIKAPVRSEAGEVVGTVGISRDITDRKEAEERVRQQALLFRTTRDAVVYSDADGRITAWNPGAERTFGYTAEEAKGQASTRLLVGDPAAASQLGAEVADALRTRGRWQGELQLQRQDGSTAVCETVALPILGEAGELKGGIAVFRDVTERRSLEEQLRQSQKLEAIGRLAGGIAHDFNNMLLVIQGFATLLEAELDDGAQAAEYLGEIRQAADRSARLTRQLLAYSRKQILQPDILDVNDTIRGLEAMLRRMIGEDVVLRVDLAEDPGAVRADPSQIEQMLVNLALNARDAMPTGGRLEIRTRPRIVSAGSPAPDPEIPAGDYVEIAVEDTGHGMDAAVLEKVFEPFFTTKPTGEGTGLGLSMVYGIVRQSDGYIWAKSEPGQGATFHVMLPRVRTRPGDGDAAAEAPPMRTGEPAHSAGTVLLLEDEPSVRDLLLRVLERGGFQVLPAATGPEALERVEAEADGPDAAILDVVLPGMSGREVAESLWRRWPELPVLFISGYTDDHILRHGISRAERHFLQKPLDPAEFLDRVRELVTAR